MTILTTRDWAITNNVLTIQGKNYNILADVKAPLQLLDQYVEFQHDVEDRPNNLVIAKEVVMSLEGYNEKVHYFAFIPPCAVGSANGTGQQTSVRVVIITEETKSE